MMMVDFYGMELWSFGSSLVGAEGVQGARYRSD